MKHLTQLLVVGLLTAGLGLGAIGSASADPAIGPRVDINTATAEQLAEALVGVGLSRAQAIVRYRQVNGAFASPEELTFVKGIGDATVERNRGRLETGR